MVYHRNGDKQLTGLGAPRCGMPGGKTGGLISLHNGKRQKRNIAQNEEARHGAERNMIGSSLKSPQPMKAEGCLSLY